MFVVSSTYDFNIWICFKQYFNFLITINRNTHYLLIGQSAERCDFATHLVHTIRRGSSLKTNLNVLNNGYHAYTTTTSRTTKRLNEQHWTISQNIRAGGFSHNALCMCAQTASSPCLSSVILFALSAPKFESSHRRIVILWIVWTMDINNRESASRRSPSTS